MPRKSHKEQEKKYQLRKKTKYLLGILLAIGILIFLIVYKIYSVDLGGTFTIAVPLENGDAALVVYGIEEDKLTRFIIPRDTVMEVSLQRGEWRMESVWKLIQSENLSRDAFSNTIIKSLKVPVDAWAEKEADGASFLTADSSLGFFEKLKLLGFASGVSKKNHEDIDFADTSYLFEARFTDGEMGYKRQSEMSAKLRHYFVSPDVALESEKIEVLNQTSGSKYAVNSLLETLETLGSHVLSVRDGEMDESLDCIVESKRVSSTVKKIISVFGCKYVEKNTGNFESRLILGEKYLDRF